MEKKEIIDNGRKDEVEEPESITMELLRDQKERNKRLSTMVIVERIVNAVLVIGIVIAFLVYLYQYDFSGTVEQNGVYTYSDSDGNVISSDISPEELRKILEVINGNDKNNSQKNQER